MPRSTTTPVLRLRLLPSQHREIGKKLTNWVPPRSLNPQREEDKFLEGIWELIVKMNDERQELEEAWLSDSSMDEEEMEEIRKMKKDVERRMKQETELARMRIWKKMGLDDDDEEEQKGDEGYDGGEGLDLAFSMFETSIIGKNRRAPPTKGRKRPRRWMKKKRGRRWACFSRCACFGEWSGREAFR